MRHFLDFADRTQYLHCSECKFSLTDDEHHLHGSSFFDLKSFPCTIAGKIYSLNKNIFYFYMKYKEQSKKFKTHFISTSFRYIRVFRIFHIFGDKFSNHIKNLRKYFKFLLVLYTYKTWIYPRPK